MTADLVRRLRLFIGQEFWSGNVAMRTALKEAAARIEALEAELADLKKEREAVDALRKHEGTPTPEIMAWAEKTFMQAEIDDLKTQINILVNVGREVWSALQTNSDYTTAILSLADVLALHPPLTDRPALEAAAAQPSEREKATKRESVLVRALDQIAQFKLQADDFGVTSNFATAVQIARHALKTYDSPATDTGEGAP